MPQRVSILLLFLLLTGCAGMGEPVSLRDPNVDLVWPPPPSPARIRFLRDIKGPGDVAGQRGRIQRLFDLVTGERARDIAFYAPYGVATDGFVLYVADAGAHVVHRYDLAAREVDYIFQAGEEFLASPVGVAVDGQGNLYVADSVNARVYKFGKGGEFIRALGDEKAALQRPAGIAINSRGDKYVADVLAHKLKIFDRDDRYVGELSGEKSGEPFNTPINVAIDREDNVYVTDSMNFKVKVFNSAGNFKRSIGEIGDAPGSFARPKGVAVDSDLHLYVVDAIHDNFQIFDREGRLLLFVGRNGERPGEFYLPSGIFIDKSDRVFVSDTYNRRIQVFQYLKEGAKQ